MEFLSRAAGKPERLGIFPGAFNPVTVAHLAVAKAALRLVDELVFVLPRTFPHKHYSGPNCHERLEMIAAAIAGQPAYSVALSEGGLFQEIAVECRGMYGPEPRLSFVCGRDAAERIVSWDYGRPGAVAGMLARFDLLVAARGGRYRPPREFAGSIAPLDLDGEFDFVSATEVRKRIARNEPWKHLTPAAIEPLIRKHYSPKR